MKKSINYFLILLLFTSCINKKLFRSFSYDKLAKPPGTVKVKENLYVDADEIRNLDYLEFLHWTQNIFGENSNEFKRVYPDTTVWVKKDSKFYNAPYESYYLTHPAYRDYPVVGVSNEQAIEFCKWRSDRVMEFILIRDGVLKNRHKNTKDSYFTIEKYFNGQYGKKSNDPYLNYYPEYTLIDTAIYPKLIPIADSVNAYLLKHCRHPKEVAKDLELWCLDKAKDTSYLDVVRPVYVCWSHKGYFIENLKGNVRELTADKNISFGGSFIDSCKTVYESNFYPNKEPNCYTGFRCICRYKKWEEK